MSEVRDFVLELRNAIRDNNVYISRANYISIGCIEMRRTYIGKHLDKTFSYDRCYYFYPALLFGGGIIATEYDEFIVKLNRYEGKILKKTIKNKFDNNYSEHKKYLIRSLLDFCKTK